MRLNKTTVYLILMLLATMVSFQNCGQPFSPGVNQDFLAQSSNAPAFTLTARPDDLINTRTAEISFDVTPNPYAEISGLEYSLDGETYEKVDLLSKTIKLTGLEDKSYAVLIRAIDSRGNQEIIPVYFSVDATSPTVTINKAPAASIGSRDASIEFLAVDGGSGIEKYECAVDAGAFAACESPLSLTNLTEALHTLKIKATDNAGNVSSEATASWTVDLTAPVLTLTSTPTAVSNSTTATFVFSAADGGVAITDLECKLDLADFTACLNTITYTGLASGTHTFQLRARDAAGNLSAPTTYNWVLDLVAPTITLVSTPQNQTSEASATFIFTATDVGSGVASTECKLDSQNFAACVSPKAYAGLSNGTHSFQVRITDGAGNVSLSNAFQWTVNRIAPTITAQPMSVTINEGSNAIFSVAATGTPTLRYQWKKNGQNISGATAASFSITNAKATDAAAYSATITNDIGSVTSQPAQLTVNASSTPPTDPPGSPPPPPPTNPPASGGGTIYYVDQTNGSDSNDGKTPATAWKNSPGLSGPAAHSGGHSLKAGDTVYFDRADTWSVSASVEGCFHMKAGVRYIGDKWGSGSGRAKIRAVGTCEAGVIRFTEDHPTLATWIEGFEVDGNNQSASGVDINHRYDRYTLTGAVKRVERVYVHDLEGDQSAGKYRYGIIARGTPTNPVANIEILDCEVYKPGRDGILAYPDSSGSLSNMTVRGCVVHGIKNDNAYNEGSGLVMKGNVRNSVFENNYIYGVNSSGILVFDTEAGVPTDGIIRNNIVHTADNNSGRGNIRSIGTIRNFNIYGNIVLPNPNGPGIQFSGTNITIRDNTIYNNINEISGGTGNKIITTNLNSYLACVTSNNTYAGVLACIQSVGL